MSYDNVKLWFAKSKDDNIITIDDINENNKNNTYACPMCGSYLIPKAIKSKQVASHFAHVDASTCNSETMIHWWFKNIFFEKGDTFVVVSDKERNYVCKEVLIEKSHKTSKDNYRPDVTVITECSNTIYFEMNYSNKKKIQDYIDIWLELNNIVVEVDIKQLMNIDGIPTFKALFYGGKCFNNKKNDIYYNTIGRYKEEIMRGIVNENLKERIKKLDWFWEDVCKYKKGNVDIYYMINIIDSFIGDEKYIVQDILKKSFCAQLYNDYKEIKLLDDPYKFEQLISESGIDVKEINLLKQKYCNFDKNYDIKIIKKLHNKSVSYYHGSRKHPYKYRKEFAHYIYNI